jgi:RHS repeat-associated protein
MLALSLRTSSFSRYAHAGASVPPLVDATIMKPRRALHNPPDRHTFSYDGLDENVGIAETTLSSVTSTKQFVWGLDRKRNSQLCETRNATGVITAQYFDMGETLNGADYFYSKDHLSSLRELTDTTGNLKAEYGYDSYGRTAKFNQSVASDFQFGGYYLHQRSVLSLTIARAYSSSLGRWLSRDPIAETGGLNMYEYVNNQPVAITDPTGLDTKNGRAGFGTGVPVDSPPANQCPFPKEPCVADPGGPTTDVRGPKGVIIPGVKFMDNHGVIRDSDGHRICDPDETPTYNTTNTRAA